MSNKLSLDDFLKEETPEGFLCTIESVPNENTKVKVTPWVNDQVGCKCESAMTLDKDMIESVVLTDNFHHCCGKKHKVVEALFKEGASIKVTELIRATIEKAHSHPKNSSHNQYNSKDQRLFQRDCYVSGIYSIPCNCPHGGSHSVNCYQYQDGNGNSCGDRCETCACPPASNIADPRTSYTPFDQTRNIPMNKIPFGSNNHGFSFNSGRPGMQSVKCSQCHDSRCGWGYQYCCDDVYGRCDCFSC